MRINLITYNSAITALSKASKMNAKVSAKSNDSRQAASVTFPKSEVVNVDKEQLWVQALELIEQLKAEGLEPDGFTYSAALSCFGAGGRWKEALDLIKTMQRGGPKMRPNKIAYTAAICKYTVIVLAWMLCFDSNYAHPCSSRTQRPAADQESTKRP